VKTYIVMRRNSWRSHEVLAEASTRAESVSAEEMADDICEIRSYVVEEDGGLLGMISIYQATSEDAIRKHASHAGLLADEILPVADTLVVRPDP